jgi:hypothetical protein
MLQPSITPPQLSSPFQAKASVPANPGPSGSGLLPAVTLRESSQTDDMFSSGSAGALISTPPLSPSALPLSLPAGGEIERLRQVQLLQQQNHLKDVETRRPDYLVRTKRTMSDADPSGLMEDELMRDRERFGTVGITESPHKGRRLTLFQETSEESFEESLMAGGYGRYVSVTAITYERKHVY